MAEPVRSSHHWHLKPLQLPEHPDSIAIQPGDTITLGRDPANTIVLSESKFPHVSGNHARLILTDDQPLIEDLDSKNGTLVNGKKITRTPLRHGDVVMLGERGPRFAVLSTSGDDGTATMLGFGGGKFAESRKLSQTTIIRIKQALGIPEEAQLADILTARSRQHHVALAIAMFVVLGVITVTILYLRSADEEQAEKILSEQTQALTSLSTELNRLREEADTKLGEQVRVWTDGKRALESERDRLQRRIEHLEDVGKDSVEEFSEVRRQLDETKRMLSLYDPVNLEQEKLKEVARVGEAVVLLEREIVYRERESGKILYLAEGSVGPNLEGKGEPFRREGTGSGFCISPEGHIVTNAHVVKPPDGAEPIGYRDMVLTPELNLSVVFTGSSRRLPAQVLRSREEEGIDIALVKIDPFPGMPFLPTLDPKIGRPEPGTEVFLYGFPLGKHALQAGDQMIASTFKGILSRSVGPYLQVDAGVYPGNSGGPITDGKGRVLAIVTAVQKYPGGATAARIGYAQPISVLEEVWPPGDPAPTKSSPKNEPAKTEEVRTRGG